MEMILKWEGLAGLFSSNGSQFLGENSWEGKVIQQRLLGEYLESLSMFYI